MRDLFIHFFSFILFAIILYIVYRIVFKKKEDTLSGSLMSIGLTLISGAFPGTTDLIANITMSVFGITSSNFESVNYPSLVSGFILLGVGVYFHNAFRNKMYILNFFGKSKLRIINDANLKRQHLNELTVRERELSIMRWFDNGTNLSEETNKNICDEIKEITETYISESIDYHRGFTGQGPIPYTCLVGTYLLHHKIENYFEYVRAEDEFIKIGRGKGLLNKYNKSPELIKNLPREFDVYAEEVIVTVSTTAEVAESDLTQFKGFPVIQFKINKTPSNNSIYHYDQLKQYSEVISKELERISKDFGNVKRVHLLMATQSCLVLEVGRQIGMMGSRIPSTAVYHFKSETTPRYPIGIIVTETDKGKLIYPN